MIPLLLNQSALPLSLLSQTATTITLGWQPITCVGYRFSAEKQAKPSHTWDPARSSVKFSKGSAWYRVEALGVAASGEWPASQLHDERGESDS